MLNKKNVLFVSDALTEPRDECDIEDLFNRTTFLQLVGESYNLDPTELTLNEKIPRIVKQIENPLAQQKSKFIKTKPASTFISKMKDTNNILLSTEELDRFEKLFELVNKRMSLRN